MFVVEWRRLSRFPAKWRWFTRARTTQYWGHLVLKVVLVSVRILRYLLLALNDRLHFSCQKIIKRDQCLVFRIWRITSSSFPSFPEGTQWKRSWSRFSQYCGLRCTTYTGKNSDVLHLKKLISVLSWLRDVNILLSSSFSLKPLSQRWCFMWQIFIPQFIYIPFHIHSKRKDGNLLLVEISVSRNCSSVGWLH